MNKINITKKDINKNIKYKTGLSLSYINEITDDFIFILKDLIKKDKTVIKNFGVFKTIFKNERIGRNPKNKKKYNILAGKTLSFSKSKNIKDI